MTTTVGTKLNVDDPKYKMNIDSPSFKPDKPTGPDEFEPEDNSIISANNSEVNPAELSEYDSPSSESDSLINPTKTKPTRRLRKRVNYADMCNNMSSSDEDSDRNKSKPNEKTLPGTGPSLSRLQAQELISKHRIIDHPPDPIHAGTSSDPEDKYNATSTVDYSGDTDEYTVPSSLVIKHEPIEDRLDKQPTGTCDLIINHSTKTSEKSSKPKQKRKQIKSVKSQNTAPSILKLKKDGSKGEWQIKSYARVKYRKTRSHPVSCK